MREESKTYLTLALGVALVLNPFAPGVHLGGGTVYQYEAAQVQYHENGSLEATSVRTGDSVAPVPVDDEIVCTDPGMHRACLFERHVLDGGNVSSYPRSFGNARYEFVYAEEGLYRPTSVERDDDWYMTLEPVEDPDPLAEIADRSDVPGIERRLTDTGRVRTYRELPHDDQLIEVGGEYYTVYTTASKSYSGLGGSFCSSGGEGFCEAADTKRMVDTLLTLGSWLVGLWLVVRAWRDCRRA